jgi:hypothetical protein
MINYTHQLKVNKEVMNFGRYVAFTINEVININTQRWILVHANVIKDWCRIPILLIVERIIDGFNLDNLTQFLIKFLIINGKLIGETITNWLMSFDTNRVNVFQVV